MRWFALALWIWTVLTWIVNSAKKSESPWGAHLVISHIWLATTLILWALHWK